MVETAGRRNTASPTGKKKNGGGDNPEPSSPKVTCIGQVRVKTKRHGNKLRSRSKRRRDVSFRRPEPEGMLQISRSYSRTHFNQQRNQRWVHLPLTICEALRSFGCDLNCLLPCRSTCTSAAGETDRSADSSEDSSCGAAFVRWLQDRDGKRRDIEATVVESPENPPESRRRRHVFEDIDISAEGFEVEVEKKTKVCVPPRNALLLMRCRSDPLKMATLANRFTENDEDEEDKIKEDEPTTVQLETEHSNNVEEDEQKLDPNLNVDESILEKQEASLVNSESGIEDTTESESESEESETENEVVAEMAGAVVTEEEEEETETAVRERSEPEEPTHENEPGKKSTEEKRVPECLMMMMSEPKLSMEVSKETWVCTTDFIRRLPEKPPVKTDVQDEPEKRISMDSSTAQPQRNKQPLQQPPRSSCYFPASSKPCEPSVLARCKSEPKKSASRLAPDACIWNNRKMEPHRPGIGAAGVGCRSRPVVG